MVEEELTGSCMVVPEQNPDSVALRLSSDRGMNDVKWSETTNKMLQGSAYILGLLIWRIQREEANSTLKCELLCKLENAEREIQELKKRRSEDAKANEKVVSIFAAHEQGWFDERKKLRQQIGALMNHFRVFNRVKEADVSKLSEQIKERDILVQSKDKLLEEEIHKGKEQEEKLKRAEKTVEELREMLKREAQEHSTELWKHKTAFIELVSTQRQLEAEMGRAVRQIEAEKQELDAVLEQKEQYVLMTQKLSMELLKTRKDLEQKDKILSAMLRKSKLDTAEKQMLLKEMKLSKTKRQQAELETEKWKTVSESRHERHSFRSILSRNHKSKSESLSGSRGVHPSAAMPSNTGKYEQSQFRKDLEVISPLSEQYMTEGNEELFFAEDIRQLEGWVRCEAEKYITAVEQRHQLEVDAFAEQLRIKDERLEAFRWQLLSMELESKRLQSHMEGLNRNLSQVKQENLKLEAVLLDREAELHSLKEHLATPTSRKSNSNSASLHDLPVTEDNVWSNVKIIKRKPGEKEKEKEKEASDELVTETTINQPKDIVFAVQSPEKEFENEKDVPLDPSSITEKCIKKEEVENAEKSAASSWKMDLHALGLSYKIKRLKQQLLMFERFTGKQEISENGENDDDKRHFGVKGFNLLISLVNKQICRYQSLQGKADDLCKRMHGNNVPSNGVVKSKETTKMLEHFLEETFQLQRYIVATGQKLTEIQTKIASGFVGEESIDGPGGATGFDTKRFADSLRALFREVQRGLEVRISKIIGDLEGTLAREGMIRLGT